jgi:ribonuclease-3
MLISLQSSYENPNLIDVSFSRRPKSSSKPQKLANLIRALDEALDEDGMDETLSLIGDEAFNRCLDLRTSLKHREALNPTATVSTPPRSQPEPSSSSKSQLHEMLSFDPNIPKTISAFSLTKWKSSTIPTTLPPLPPVLDPTLETAAFTSAKCGSGRPDDLSYERLEWVGDAYLYLTSTLLISQTFPNLGPGKFSQLRERLIKNLTLSSYSLKYEFEKRAIFPNPGLDSYPEPDKIKILGDIFEAYVAAVVLSDPVDGVIRVSEWLKDVWGMELAKEIIYEERHGMKLDNPMWRLRGQDTRSLAEPVPLNAKSKLHKLIGAKGVKLSYRDCAPEKKDPKNKLPLFTVGVYLDGWGEKDRMLGSGRANGKKEAAEKAAEMALGHKSLMKQYTDKKALYDAQMALVQEALKKLG